MGENRFDWSDLERPSLRQQQLRRALVVPGSLFCEVRVVEQTGSTNADLVARAHGGAAEGTVLVAEAQTAGRGRLHRGWAAPPRAGLTFSVLLRPPFAASRWSWLPLLAAVAVAQPLARLSRLDVRLKWPNDVLVGEQKLAGILTERADDAVVIGVGLNVSQRADELPVPSATSLVLAGSQILDRDPILRGVLRSFAQLYDDLRLVGGDPEAAGLRGAYVESCSTLGRDVQVQLPGGRVVDGEAVDVDVDGRLVIRTPEGLENAIGAGDVVHVR